jgi:hypothetical protein
MRHGRRRGQIDEWRKRVALKSSVGKRGDSCHVEKGGEEVDKGHKIAADDTAGHSRAGDDEWNTCRSFVPGIVAVVCVCVCVCARARVCVGIRMK